MTANIRQEWFTKWFTCACLASFFLMSAGTIEAKTLAVVGETFPVAEQSFLVFIESRLHQLDETGDMAAIEQQMILDASRHANRPTPVELPRATAHHTHEYTPRVVLANDILDHLNRVLIPRGTFVNALEQLPYYEPHWVFINADDEAQVHWVKRVLKVRPDSKVILTGGAIGSSERALNSEIFFDQSGRISHQLGIKHVPAKVSRDGMHLRIDELVIGENGDVR